MYRNPFAPDFKDLPETLPVFPLSGVLLLPFGQLPLNVFEPRYVRMVDDALKGARIIGMIQPRMAYDDGENPALYTVGCAGKITEFSHTEDGRYLISLTGLCRFRVTEELAVNTPYRQVRGAWGDFESDLGRKACLGVERAKLESLLDAYFERHNMSCDFKKFEGVADGNLMTCLSMICPFEPQEKQALLEQVCCAERAKLFMKMLEMAIKQNGHESGGCCCH
ncbi:MAG: LON peptidase substrate-binding domain-containing protein [Alphaproteobacteria bacterium]|nr:LON peptidase substrate-binding domain-containing protein [Alphaproteobacteria bacterium]